MSILSPASVPTPRYQTIRGAHWTARPLTPDQELLLTLCDRPVTLADLLAATHALVSEVSEALAFLRKHALVKLVAPAPPLPARTRWYR
jgi:hypothetical protein